MGTYSLFACTDHRRQVAHRQYKFRLQRWSRSLQVRAMHKRHLQTSDIQLMPQYSVMLTSCICSHTACWLIDIYSWVTIPVICNDKLVGQFAARSGSPHDKSSH